MRTELYQILLVCFSIVTPFCEHALAGPRTWSPTSAPGLRCALSADGKVALATTGLGQIYVTTNGGLRWIEETVSPLSDLNWGVSVATSADGVRSVLGSASGDILVSTNSGSTWREAEYLSTQIAGTSVACSGDGTRMAAAAPLVGIYVSTNSGSDWHPTTAPDVSWSGVAWSADGTRLLANDGTGTLYVSTDSGQTWVSNSMPSASVFAVSADARTLITANSSGDIYVSTNSGAAWTQSKSAPKLYWESVASSADGTRFAAVPAPAAIYTSVDAGATWISNAVPSVDWWTVCSSADGFKLMAAGDGIWVSQVTSPPDLKIAAGINTVVISWLIPSTHFVLQQTSDLSSSSWQDVTSQPVLDYSNLNYEVSVQNPTGTVFYRLVSR